jgi:hypothetical protein
MMLFPENSLSPYVEMAAARYQAAENHRQALTEGKEPDPDIDWEQLEETRYDATISGPLEMLQ